MKKILYAILITLLFIPTVIFAKDKDINIYLFHGQECPHCEEERQFLDKYLRKNENVHLHSYEVWHNEENAKNFMTTFNVATFGEKKIKLHIKQNP